jgi:uncharacterized protein (TIGR02599 family)
MSGWNNSGSRTSHRFALRTNRGFTLVEMIVSMVILGAIVAIIYSMIQETSNAWKNTSGKIEGFRNARTAFDAMTRTISQATLNTYFDYAYVNGGSLNFIPLGNSTPPTTYARNSDLQIVEGQASSLLTSVTGYSCVTHAIMFQSPLGEVSPANASTMGSLDKLLNACGFYVTYGPNPVKPSFLPSSPPRYRYRLMQFSQPSDSLCIYAQNASGQRINWGNSNWYLPFIQSDATAVTPTSDFVLAENVIALILEPKLALKDEAAADTAYGISTTSTPLGTALAPNYAYDSSTVGQGGTLNATTGRYSQPLLNSMNQLPPVIQVTVVALDEASALKLGNTTTAPNTALGLTSTLFTQAKNFQSDMTTLQSALNASHLNYRVFQTDVAIRGAKWTSDN